MVQILRLRGTMTKNKGIGNGIGKRKMGLTPKQAKFLAIIKDFMTSNGYAPSYEEIKQLNGMRSKSNVHAYVHHLKKRGYLDVIGHTRRSIVVL